jgi:hypothetical protein
MQEIDPMKISYVQTATPQQEARQFDVLDRIMFMLTTEGVTNGEALRALATMAAYFLTICPNERARFHAEVDEQIQGEAPLSD